MSPKRKKIIFLVIDGLADEKIPDFFKKTPLEKARKPCLDYLAKNGLTGLVIPYHEKGKLPTSEDSHLALFGYDPQKNNPGRGVLEALGARLVVKKNDVCFRGNFATVDENLRILDRRAKRIERTEALIEALKKIKLKKFPDIKLIIKKTFGHRFVLLLRGKNLSEKVTSNDPKRNNAFVLKIKPKDKKAKRTALFLEDFLKKAYWILKDHPLNKKRDFPANFLLLRGAGRIKKVLSFEKKYKLKACVIAGGNLYKGIGRFLGMKEINVKGATGKTNTNLKNKFLSAKKSLKKYDFVFLHIKAPDNLAEDGDFMAKKRFIEKIDQHLRILLNLNNVFIVVTGDHATCSLLKSHCSLPIPLLVYNNSRPDIKDNVSEFSERACQKGKLGLLKQIDVLKTIFSVIG